jgi:hypothetical protein
MLITLYLLSLVLIILLMRPRLIIYNVTSEQLRPALLDIAARLDPEAVWAGDSLVLPQLGVQLHCEWNAMFKNAQLVAAGPHQNLTSWRQLELELSRTFYEDDGKYAGAPNPYGASLMLCGLTLAAFASYWLYKDPDGVMRSLQTMLRQ